MNLESWQKIRQFPDLKTPYFLFNGSYFREDAKALYTGLCKHLPTIQINYSTKTNHLPACLNIAREMGFYFEVVGPDDLATCLKISIPGYRISLGGPSWTKALVQEAVSVGVGQFICDSYSNAQILLSLIPAHPQLKNVRVGFRIYDGESHFGFSPSDLKLEELVKQFEKVGVSQLGLHLHRNPGGSVESMQELVDDFSTRAKILLSVAQKIQRPAFFNLGGGIDSPWVYRVAPAKLGDFHNPNASAILREKAAPRPRFSLEKAGEEVGAIIKKEISEKFPHAQIQLEPGRAVCTRALSTVLSVTAVKKDFYPNHQVLITDGSTAALGPIHRSIHSISAEKEGSAPSFVYGHLPHSGDWLFQNISLPQMREGEKLLVENTGAYFLALESKFGFPFLKIYDSESGREIHRQ